MDHSPAIDFILNLLGGNDGSPAPSLSAADWAEFTHLAGTYRVAPLLYARIKKRNPAAPVPPDVALSLQRLSYSSTFTIECLLRELGQVLTAFKAQGIAVIVLKGAHLAALVYPRPGLRPMADIDLLVRKSDLSTSSAVLTGLGYTRDAAFDGLEGIKAPHLHYVGPGRAPLEVHWQIEQRDSPFEIDLDGLWERARPATIAGVEVLVLSPDDLLLHLCMHVSFHHGFHDNGLRALCDIAEAIRYYGDQLDWSQLLRRSRAWRSDRATYVTLNMAAALLRVPVPDAVLRDLAPSRQPDRLLPWAEERLLRDPAGGDGPVSDGWGRIYAARSLSARIRAALHALFPAPGTLARKYAVPATARSLYFYYPVHLKDLCRDHAGRAWRLWRGDPARITWAQRERCRVEEQDMRRWMAEP